MMDPDVTLSELRATVRCLRALDLVEELSFDVETLVTGLLDRIEALDTWLASGGFKPADWACRDTLVEAVGPGLAELLAAPNPAEVEARRRARLAVDAARRTTPDEVLALLEPTGWVEPTEEA